MKRYLVLVLLLVGSFSVLGQNNCKVNHFYQSGTTTDITDVVYGTRYDMELVVSYNPLDQLTDKLRVVLQLPVGENSYVTAALNANPIIISNQYLDYNQNRLTVDITGFSKTQQSTFTINVYNATINAVSACAPTVFTATSYLQYYTDANSAPIDFPNNQFSSTIYGKHSIGTISTALVFDQTFYSPTSDADANSPMYVDLSVYSSGNTYVGAAMLVYFNSNLSIKKVVYGDNLAAQTVVVGNKQYYSMSTGFHYVRVYFDMPENTTPVSLTLTGDAIFSICSNQNTSFPIAPINVSFPGKPDNAILAYPSISNSFNYMNTRYDILSCGSAFTPYVQIDNIYNTNIVTPIVLTADIGGNILAQSLSFEGDVFPDKVLIRICGNSAYETTPLIQSNGVYTIPSNQRIDKVRLEFSHLTSSNSFFWVNCISAGNHCGSSSAPSVIFKLLKNEQDYITIAPTLTPAQTSNNIAINYSKNILAPQEKIRATYLYFEVNNTLQPTDYLSYTLSDNMTFPIDHDVKIAFDYPNFLSFTDFNAQYFSTNPMTYNISPDRKTLTITNITIKGKYSDCSVLPSHFYIQITSQVSAKPTSISNTNVFALYNKDGVNLLWDNYYNWSVASTQAVTNTVFFSCDGGTTRTAGITIKQGDALNVYYTLENTTLYKYDQKAFTFYCTLPTAGLEPTLLLTKNTSTGNIIIPSIITPDLYTVSYATGNLDNYASLTYSGSSTGATILRVQIPAVTVDAYEKLILSLAYATTPGLTSNNAVRFYAAVGTLIIPPQSSALIIGTKSDCDLFNCVECVTSFSPTAGEEYIISAWVKESVTGNPPTTYTNSGIRITFNDGAINTFPLFRPTGPIVDGWQRIEASFIIPAGAQNIHIALVNESANTDVFFDDIRIHPYNSNMKSFVYNPSTQKLVAELDENNFATKYEYDDEGILIRVKKETERGVMTIKETRSNQSKIR